MNEYKDEIKIMKALCHPARLEILETLRQGEACVCHMESLFGWRQAYISQQLMVLREAGLVTDRRDGWNIFYRVVKPEIYIVLDAVNRVTGHTNQPNLRIATLETCTCPHCQVDVKAPAV
jgi:DNA-binding transcriptional ArsR family regulator